MLLSAEWPRISITLTPISLSAHLVIGVLGSVADQAVHLLQRGSHGAAGTPLSPRGQLRHTEVRRGQRHGGWGWWGSLGGQRRTDSSSPGEAGVRDTAIWRRLGLTQPPESEAHTCIIRHLTLGDRHPHHRDMDTFHSPSLSAIRLVSPSSRGDIQTLRPPEVVIIFI